MTHGDTGPERSAPASSTARKLGVRLAAGWVLFPLVFLATSGDARWWGAWLYCLVTLLPATVFSLMTLRADPAFLERRFVIREKERTQRRVMGFGTPVFLGLYVVPGLDRRFGWSTVPDWLVAGGLLVSVLGYAGILGVFHANRWAGRTIETHAEQRVIDTGPYAVVRHPMYAAAIVLYGATPLALGSLWSLVPAALTLPFLVARIRNEEEVLVRELAGYADYRTRVRFRLVPGLW